MPDDSRILVTKPLARGHCLSFQPLLCGSSPRVGSLGLDILNILSCPGSSSIAKTPEILHCLKLWCHKAGKPAQLMQDAGGCPHPHPCSPSHHPGHPASSFFLLIVFLFFARSLPCFGHFPALSHAVPGVLFHTGRQTWSGGKAPTFPAHGEVTPSQ